MCGWMGSFDSSGSSVGATAFIIQCGEEGHTEMGAALGDSTLRRRSLGGGDDSHEIV